VEHANACSAPSGTSLRGSRSINGVSANREPLHQYLQSRGGGNTDAIHKATFVTTFDNVPPFAASSLRTRGDFMRLIFACCLFASIFSTPIRTIGEASNLNAQPSPVGRWKTVDDATGKVKSVVLIWEANGKLYGKIEKLIDPDPQYPDPGVSLPRRDEKGPANYWPPDSLDLHMDGDFNGQAARCSIRQRQANTNALLQSK